MLRLFLTTLILLGGAGSATAGNWSVAIPDALPGGGSAPKDALWQFFLQEVGPGDRYGVFNATKPGRIAWIEVPDDPKFENPRRRVKTFARALAEIGAFADTMRNDRASSDLMGSLRHVALNRPDDAPIDLLVVGGVQQVIASEPAFSMVGPHGPLVPSAAHLTASVAETPYGMGSEGARGLRDVYVHLCPVEEALSSDAEAAYQRFFGAYIAARSGVLVTWSYDLSTCIARFGARARQPIAFERYAAEDDTLAMIPVTRVPPKVETIEEPVGAEVTAEIDVLPPDTTTANGVEVEKFSVFAFAPHPMLPGVEVTTGIEYGPSGYPEVYTSAWCYFNVRKGGVDLRFDLGRKSYNRPVEGHSSSASARRSGGISRQAFEAGKEACQWPTP